jgi:hypothetical protein
MAITGGASKEKSRGSSNQSFDQTASTRLSDRSFDMLSGRLGELGGQRYQALGANDYQTYMNPYQQEVIDATTADINANRDLAANQQRSDIAGAGAFGDKRRGIAEAELAGQYDRTLATALGGLRSRGFSEAQGVAQNENANRNQFDANTQAQINQLLALLGQETVTNTQGNSRGQTRGTTTGMNMGFSWSPSGGFG